MLILSRKIGESLMIGDDIKITVLGIQGNQIKIGIDAPEEVDIMREELYNKGVRSLQLKDNTGEDET